MWLISLILLSRPMLGEFSITFPNASDKTEIQQIHDFYQPSPLVDSVASLGIHAVTDLLTSESNVIVSPVNVFLCLDILKMGAAGKTKEEIVQIVGHSKSSSKLSKVLEAMRGTSHASAVFFNEGIVPRAEFLRESYSKYETEVINVDFKDSPRATFSINSWVSQKTNGTIREILSEEVDPSSEVVVASALLFNGKWLHPFSTLVTETGRFEVDEGTFVDVPMMHLEAFLPVIRRTQYNAVGLPYNDGKLVMYVILPHNYGLNALRKVLYSFSPTDVKHFPVASAPQKAFVEMPKFKVESRLSLKDPLVKQGLKTSFHPDLANFTEFTENKMNRFSISDLVHSVHFEVNEHETIASAASAAIFTKTRSFQFKATRPFLFVISDETGLLLFMGAVMRPG